MDVIRFMREHRPYFEDFVTRSTYHSNAIEGNTLSYAETYAILFNDNSLKVTATARELYEAINHKYALSKALENPSEELSERLIKDVAVVINRNINEISGYRTVPVFIAGAQHIPPAPDQVGQQMMQLVYEHNHCASDDIFLTEAQFHLRFERIHPFEDGNGRTGRILLNRALMREGIAPVVIPVEQRARYMELLAQHDDMGLAAFFKELSLAEKERLQLFAQA